MSDFINFKESKPSAGMVTWRSKEGDIPFLFNAEMRWRGAGYENALSPEFDYWDGYKLHVKHDVEWSSKLIEMERNEVKPECEIMECPFCKRIPKVIYAGRYINAPPMHAKYFYFKCCSFINSGFSASSEKLKGIVDGWNNALGGSLDGCAKKVLRLSEQLRKGVDQ